ncbi:MAG: ankyrin repeat domain-containing protein [Proteobacteria bacterium]|nr:ankyrin repeat domain-containing protein [Pseudomonadota bacterium]
MLSIASEFEKAINHIYKNNRSQLKKQLQKNPLLRTQADSQGNTLLHHGVLALKQTDKSSLDLLFEFNFVVNKKNNAGQTAFLLGTTLDIREFSFKYKKVDFSKLMLSKGADIYAANTQGLNALHFAALNNHVSLITSLIAEGIYVDYVSSQGFTALHLAALAGHKEACEILMKHGADLTSSVYPGGLASLNIALNPNDQYITPLALTLYSQNKEVVDYLFDLEKHINQRTLVSLRDRNGGNLLHFFASTGDINRFQQAVNIGCDPFLKNKQGYMPFHVACSVGELKIVQYIVELPASRNRFDINSRTQAEETGLALATRKHHQAVQRYLCNHGAKRFKHTTRRAQNKGAIDVISEQYAWRAELEATSGYQWFNTGRMIGGTLLSYSGGPHVMVAQAVHQLLLYSVPTLRRLGSNGYYAIKPHVHNYAPKIVEAGLDIAATTTSYAVTAGAYALDIADIFSNPIRRSAGLVTSLLLANAAARITENKDWQGAAYVVGRELGMFAVEAYHIANSVKNPNEKDEFDAQLSNALTVWTSILGKGPGEQFVYGMHSFTQLHQSLLSHVGWLEHSMLHGTGTTVSYLNSLLPELSFFNQLQNSTTAASSLIDAAQVAFYAPQDLFAKAQHYAKKITNLRQKALTEIENAIALHCLPDSEYRNYAVSMLRANQLALLQSEKITLESNKNKAQENLKALEEGSLGKPNNEASMLEAKKALENASKALDAINQKITESKAAYDLIWSQTPKGIKEAALTDADKAHFEAQVKYEDLKVDVEYLQKHDIQDQTLLDKQNELAQAKSELESAYQKLESAKSAWKEVINSVEKNYYESREKEFISKNNQTIADFVEKKQKSLNDFDNFNQEQEQLGNEWLKTMQASMIFENAQGKLDEIELRIKAIDNPVPFIASEVASNALKQYPRDSEQVIRIVLDAFVATGAISRDDAIQRIQSSLYNALAAHKYNDKLDQLKIAITNHWLSLPQDYKHALLNIRNLLQREVEIAAQNLNDSQKEYQNHLEKATQANETYSQSFEEQDKVKIISDFSSSPLVQQPYNWTSENNLDAIKQTLSLVGQPAYAIGAIVHSGGGASHHHIAAYVAKWLIDYKYLFMKAPDSTLRHEEVLSLAKELSKNTVNESTVEKAKLSIEHEVAQNLLSSQASTATDKFAQQVCDKIQAAFKIHDSAPDLKLNELSLATVIAQELTAQNPTGAQNAIVEVLKTTSHDVSISIAGKYVPPVYTPHVPSKPHGIHKLWRDTKDFIQHYGSKIFEYTGGVSVQVSGEGIGAGFTNGNMFPVVGFDKKPTQLFKIPGKPSEKEDSSKPVPTQVVSSPLPKIITMPWERDLAVEVTAPSIKPLVFSPALKTPVTASPVKTRPEVSKVETSSRPSSHINPFIQPEFDLIDASGFSHILAVKDYVLSKPLIAQGTDWARMLCRAVLDINDPLVLRWQQDMRQQYPLTQAFFQGFEGSKVTDVLYLFKGMGKALKELGEFSGAEIFRLTHGEESVIGETIRQASDFLSDPNKIYAASEIARAYVRDEFGRLCRSEDTVTGAVFEKWLAQVGQTPKEELLTNAGKELMFAVLGEGMLRGAGLARDAVIPMLQENITKEFFERYGVRFPLEFSLEPGRLYSGFPLDQFRTQWPMYAKATEKARDVHNPISASNSLRLRVQLELQEKGVLDMDGWLTKAIIAESERALGPFQKISNPQVLKELTKDGSSAGDWRKLKTQPIILKSGQKIQVHYYYNPITGVQNNTIDYKVKELVMNPYSTNTFGNETTKARDDRLLLSGVTGMLRE